MSTRTPIETGSGGRSGSRESISVKVYRTGGWYCRPVGDGAASKPGGTVEVVWRKQGTVGTAGAMGHSCPRRRDMANGVGGPASHRDVAKQRGAVVSSLGWSRDGMAVGEPVRTMAWTGGDRGEGRTMGRKWCRRCCDLTNERGQS